MLGSDRERCAICKRASETWDGINSEQQRRLNVSSSSPLLVSVQPVVVPVVRYFRGSISRVELTCDFGRAGEGVSDPQSWLGLCPLRLGTGDHQGNGSRERLVRRHDDKTGWNEGKEESVCQQHVSIHCRQERDAT